MMASLRGCGISVPAPALRFPCKICSFSPVVSTSRWQSGDRRSLFPASSCGSLFKHQQRWPYGGRVSILVKSRHGRKYLTVSAAANNYYDILGVSKSASEKEIKSAYRKLALKFHPDVNKEPNAETRFLEIKEAYQTLIDPGTRAKYDGRAWGGGGSGGFRDPFDAWGAAGTWGGGRQKGKEDFYGLDDFFRDVAKDLDERSSRRGGKAKGLWEELADIGEEFVEDVVGFLEKELNLTEPVAGGKNTTSQSESSKGSSDNRSTSSSADKASSGAKPKEEPKKPSLDVDELLAQLKREMGL